MTLREDKDNRISPSDMTIIVVEDDTIMGIVAMGTMVSQEATEATTTAAGATQIEVVTMEAATISNHAPQRQTMEGEMMPQDNNPTMLRQVVLKTIRVLRTVQLKLQRAAIQEARTTSSPRTAFITDSRRAQGNRGLAVQLPTTAVRHDCRRTPTPTYKRVVRWEIVRKKTRKR